MDQTTTDLPPTPPPADPTPRRLVRSDDDRMIAGVCGGLGGYLGVDPVLVRLAFVVLALAGGIGVAAYLIAWAVLPDSSGVQPPGWRMWLRVLAIVAVGLVVLTTIFDDDFGDGLDFPELAVILLAIGAVLVWGSRDRDRSTQRATPAAPVGSTVGLDPALGTAPLAPPLPATDRWPAPEARPARLRPGWWKSLALAVTGLVVAVGVVAVAVAWSDNADPDAVLGGALVAIGAVMVCGVWLGRARALVPAALVIFGAVAAVSLLDVPLSGGFSDRSIDYDDPADLPDAERLAAGNLEIDLTELDLAGTDQRLEASVTFGQIEVIVPAGMALDVHARVSGGSIDVLGRYSDGADTVIDRSFPGAEGTGRLVLDLAVGLGEVEVRRG